MKKNILYISGNKIKTDEILKIINSNENWSGIAAYSELEAIQLFLEHDIAMVIFAYDIKSDIEQALSRYYTKIKPTVILLDPYGGATGLLHQEINHAFEIAINNELIS